MANGPNSSIRLVPESELRDLAVAMVRMEGKIDRLTELSVTVDALTARVTAIEMVNAAAGGRTEVRRSLLETYLVPTLLALIGTGLWVSWFFPSGPLPH